jgi:hypothetical protein
LIRYDLIEERTILHEKILNVKTFDVAWSTDKKVLARRAYFNQILTRELTLKDCLPCSEPLQFFLKNKITLDAFDSANLDLFSQLDDFYIIKRLAEE